MKQPSSHSNHELLSLAFPVQFLNCNQAAEEMLVLFCFLEKLIDDLSWEPSFDCENA